MRRLLVALGVAVLLMAPGEVVGAPQTCGDTLPSNASAFTWSLCAIMQDQQLVAACRSMRTMYERVYSASLDLRSVSRARGFPSDIDGVRDDLYGALNYAYLAYGQWCMDQPAMDVLR